MAYTFNADQLTTIPTPEINDWNYYFENNKSVSGCKMKNELAGRNREILPVIQESGQQD